MSPSDLIGRLFRNRSPERLAAAEERARSAEEALQQFKANPTRFCSFCGKSQHDAGKIIVGPGGISICDGCVSHCVDILLGNRARTNSKEQTH